MKYRKIPEEIDAVQLLGINGAQIDFDEEEKPQWLTDLLTSEEPKIRRHPMWPDTRLQVEEAERSNVIVEFGDYIVLDSEGRLRVYKPDAFKSQFVEV